MLRFLCHTGTIFDPSFLWLTDLLLSLFVLVYEIACLSIFLSTCNSLLDGLDDRQQDVLNSSQGFVCFFHCSSVFLTVNDSHF